MDHNTRARVLFFWIVSVDLIGLDTFSNLGVCCKLVFRDYLQVNALVQITGCPRCFLPGDESGLECPHNGLLEWPLRKDVSTIC